MRDRNEKLEIIKRKSDNKKIMNMVSINGKMEGLKICGNYEAIAGTV